MKKHLQIQIQKSKDKFEINNLNFYEQENFLNFFYLKKTDILRRNSFRFPPSIALNSAWR